MAYNVLSKKGWKRTAQYLALSVLGFGLVPGLIGAPAAYAETTQEAQLVSELTSIHTYLQGHNELSDVQTVDAAIRSFSASDWAYILYGTSSPTATETTTSTDLGTLLTDITFQGVTTSIATVNGQLVNTLNTLGASLTPSVSFTGTDVDNFVQSINTGITANLPSALLNSSVSNTDVVAAAIASALTSSTNASFKALFSYYGLGSLASSTTAPATLTGITQRLQSKLTGSAATLYPTAKSDLIAALASYYASLSSGSGTGGTGGGGGGGGSFGGGGGGGSVSGGGGAGGTGGSGSSTGGTGSTGGSGGTGGTGGTTTPPSPGFSHVVLTQPVDSSAKKVTTTVSGSQVTLDIPAGAFTTPETVTLSTGNPVKLDDSAPHGYSAALTFGISFSGAAPSVPITLTIQNSAIPSGAKVFKVTSAGAWVPVQATVTNGKAVITFSTDPNFVIVKPYQMTKKNIYLNGQEIEQGVPGFALGGTTYMPIWYVMHALDLAGYTSKWSGSVWNFTPPSSVKVDKANVQPGTGSMSIDLGGTLVQNVNGVQAVDPNSKKNTTFMPIWYVMQTLKRAGVTSAWDGTNWKLSVSGAPIAVSTAHPTLQVGATGTAVKQLQQLLGLVADGVFGPQTAQAVKSFQVKNHLTADGVVGPQTWAALLK
jgi:hypothetical protein